MARKPVGGWVGDHVACVGLAWWHPLVALGVLVVFCALRAAEPGSWRDLREVGGVVGDKRIRRGAVLLVMYASAVLATSSAGPELAASGPRPVPSLPALPGPAAMRPPPAVVGPAERLALPTQGVEALVVPVDVLADGDLVVPDDPHVLGWWREGALPGDRHGAIVVDGHVDTRRDGEGALFRLAELHLGDPIVVTTAGARLAYVVQDVHRYSKAAALPTELFEQDGPPRLVVITCGGAFDRRTRQYADNTVVMATPG